jgi:hypothetical protein
VTLNMNIVSMASHTTTSRRSYIEQQLREKRGQLIEAQIDLDISYAIGDEYFAVSMQEKPLEERITWNEFLHRQQLLIDATASVVTRLEELLEHEPAPAPEPAPEPEIDEVVLEAAHAWLVWFREGVHPPYDNMTHHGLTLDRTIEGLKTWSAK